MVIRSQDASTAILGVPKQERTGNMIDAPDGGSVNRSIHLEDIQSAFHRYVRKSSSRYQAYGAAGESAGEFWICK